MLSRYQRVRRAGDTAAYLDLDPRPHPVGLGGQIVFHRPAPLADSGNHRPKTAGRPAAGVRASPGWRQLAVRICREPFVTLRDPFGCRSRHDSGRVRRASRRAARHRGSARVHKRRYG